MVLGGIITGVAALMFVGWRMHRPVTISAV